MDSCPQTFFFSLINQLKIQKADNILEIACGAGLLLPFVIDQKKP
jgi:cyclopropane fatty-acyl-phospholipid synthase-like methyltransferase